MSVAVCPTGCRARLLAGAPPPRPRLAIALDARPRRNKGGVLDAVFPNCGIEAAYRKALLKLVSDMHESFLYWLAPAYKKEPTPIELAQDASSTSTMMAAIRKLIKRWERRFAWAAPKLAEWFAKSANSRSDADLKNILRRGGISVRFQLTKAQREIIAATIAENVALIKSIPQRYHQSVVPIVMQAVKEGRKQSELVKELKKQFRVTQRRAELIARDQNNKATAQLVRARQVELGIKKAIWLHSGGGRVPRPTHVKQSGKPYDVVRGWYDPHEKKHIHPGQLINCRCVSKSIIPGL
jgi:SPP1 gp7 family putative phage head morphogenesis protein